MGRNMEYKKRIFQILCKEIGSDVNVQRYYDRQNESNIDIYIAKNRQVPDLLTYSTIGLLEYTIGMKDRNDREIRIELIGTCSADAEVFPNILASCVFNIINSKYTCKPGIVYPGVITPYLDEMDMKHIYFTSPFFWGRASSV